MIGSREVYMKFYAEPSEHCAGRYQVMCERNGQVHCMDDVLSKVAAMRAIRHMSRAALLAGAILVE